MKHKLKLDPQDSQEDSEFTWTPAPNGNDPGAVFRLKRLIAELIQEVELINCGHSRAVEIRLQQANEQLNFYEEVARFEIALIKNALQRTGGNQRVAARLLNLNPSTLNAKLKHYNIRTFPTEPPS